MKEFVAAALLAGLLIAVSAPTTAAAGQSDAKAYQIRYQWNFVPADDRVDVTITLGKGAERLHEARFSIDPERHTGFKGDGKIEAEGGYLTWVPPAEGGSLAFSTPINHQKKSGSFDARMTERWAVFRGDDLVPPARVKIAAGAEATASLEVKVPKGWSFRAPYVEVEPGVFRIEHQGRSFDRPTGWFVAGELGARREMIDGVDVLVAGPIDQGVRRMDLLAFLRWNLPEVRKVFRAMPRTLLVVTAGDRMWRGGLSGPGSLFIHARLPLISENGTSTLLHEVIHTASSLHGDDWIVEGLAEYYSVELMRRSGTLSNQRSVTVVERLQKWGKEAESLDARRSTGATTARSVAIFAQLDKEIRAASEEAKTIDDVVARLEQGARYINLAALREATQGVAGKPSKTLAELP